MSTLCNPGAGGPAPGSVSPTGSALTQDCRLLAGLPLPVPVPSGAEKPGPSGAHTRNCSRYSGGNRAVSQGGCGVADCLW